MIRMIGTVLVLASWASVANAADWPQYRFDVGRTAANSQSLPAELHLTWTRQLPAPRPVFPQNPQLNYDATYEPVVVGKTLFVPSMVTDSVAAIDTDTGKVRWRFFAEGPVRFAPVAWQDKVAFVSDDGYLYCLSATDGRLLWKFRGLPTDRTDRKVIGDGRLISIFPARGGPVLSDGIIYFAAGIWSDEGVFVHALDADSGRVVWSNTTSGQLPCVNADHGVGADGGISPQGHLAIVNGALVVPCGQQLPALLDAKTGKLHTYTMGHGGKFQQPKGSVFVSGVGKYLFHTGDLYDIGQLGKGDSLNDVNVDYDEIKKQMLYVGGLPRLQVDPTNLKKDLGDFRKPVLTQRAMYHRDGEDLVAYDLTEPSSHKNPASGGRKGPSPLDPESLSFAELWRLPGISRPHIQAGNRLYCAGPDFVEAVDIPSTSQAPKIGWRSEIPGRPHRLLAADDKLFVVTESGAICAFAGGENPSPVTHKPPQVAPDGPKDAEAAKLLADAGVSDGYVVMLGMDDPGLAEAIARKSKCDVVAIVADGDEATKLRERFFAAGLYGSRITVLTGDPASYRLPPYLASLMILNESTSKVLADDLGKIASLFERLRPYGGACLGLSESALAKLPEALASGEMPGGVVRKVDAGTMLVRQGPLIGAADWSHENANAANTGASLDQRVEPPLKRLWFSFANQWGKRGSWVRIAGGRILVCEDGIQAVDLYTGRSLWQAKCEATKGDIVAVSDEIYLSGKSCEILDATTGRTVGELAMPAGSGSVSNVRVDGDAIVASRGECLACFDRSTRQIRWTHNCENSIHSVAVGGGKVFCVDGANPRRSGRKGAEASGVLTTLSIRDGSLLWKIPGIGDVQYGEPKDVVLLGTELGKGQQRDPQFNSNDFRVKTFAAYRGADGKELWRDVEASHAFLTDGKAITYMTHKSPKVAFLVAYDLQTGRKVGEDVEWYQRGCTVLRAGAHLLTTRYLGNAAFCDLSGERMTTISNVRAACTNNLYPGDGVLAAPSLSVGCFCNYIPASLVLAPATAFEHDGGNLQKP